MHAGARRLRDKRQGPTNYKKTIPSAAVTFEGSLSSLNDKPAGSQMIVAQPLGGAAARVMIGKQLGVTA